MIGNTESKMKNKINWFFKMPHRVIMTLLFGMFALTFFGGIILTLFWTPVAFIFIFLSPVMIFILHLSWMPRKYDQWSTIFFKGLWTSNKILREVYMANSDKDFFAIYEKYR